MLRRLGGCAVALALLVPTQATASPSAPAERTQTITRTRVVELGHPPVRATTLMKVRLIFSGRKGQLVNLTRVNEAEQCGTRVLRSGGRTIQPWAQGYWRLPRTATYTAINKPCGGGAKGPVRLQVRKVVREARLASGASVTAGRSAKVTHLVPFRVGEQEQARLSGTTFDLVRPDGTIVSGIDGTPAYAVQAAPGPVGEVPSPPGRYFVALAPRASVSLSTRAIQPVRTQTKVPVTVDGPAVVVPRGDPGTADTALELTGQAGQWIYVEQTSTSGGPVEGGWWTTQLRDPSNYFPARVTVECPWTGQPSCAVTRLPATGTYLVDVFSGTGSEVSVRVRSAAVAAPATVDGPPVTYTVTSPGRWVVGELPELPRQASGGSEATLTLGNVTGDLGEWRVRAVSGYGPCNPGLGVGCFNATPQNEFTLSPFTLTSPLPWDAFANPAIAALAVPPGATGSLDLAVTRPTS